MSRNSHEFTLVAMKLFLFVIVACEQICNGYRILGIFPLNSRSHWVTGEQLMKGLAKRGHHVDVVTHFPSKIPISNYTDINIGGSLPNLISNLTATEIMSFSGISLQTLTDKYGIQICHLLKHPKLQELIKNPPRNEPYDVIVVQLFVAPCFLAFARHLKVPIVGLVASTFHDWFNEVSGNPDNPSFIPSIFSGFSQYMNFKERLINFLLTNWISYQAHHYANKQVVLVQHYFNIDISSIKDLYDDISLYLVNSHHSINGIRPMTTSVVEIGGAHINDDHDSLSSQVQKWLDESKDGCVYFTFGSMVRIETFPKELLQQFYESFKKITPVRVLMKIAKREELPSGLPKNVMTQSWFPQIAVFKHKNIRAFITHGGLLGTQESVYFGVPMVGIPLFTDQHINIKNYVHKKIAVSLESINDVTEKKLTSALNSVLKDPSYLKNARRLSKLFLDRPIKAIDTAMYWIEYVTRYGKILKSPITQLYWWQRNLLDIYAFIFILISIVLYIVIFILRKFRNLLCKLHCCRKVDNAMTKLKKNK